MVEAKPNTVRQARRDREQTTGSSPTYGLRSYPLTILSHITHNSFEIYFGQSLIQTGSAKADSIGSPGWLIRNWLRGSQDRCPGIGLSLLRYLNVWDTLIPKEVNVRIQTHLVVLERRDPAIITTR